jgi:hypothetical protein
MYEEKKCTRCCKILPLSSYGVNTGYKGAKILRSHCKACEVRRVHEWREAGNRNSKEESRRYRERNRHKHNAKEARRRAYKRQATPAVLTEYDQFFIEEIYSLAQERSICTGVPNEVDHIIPLKNDRVCGLHVPCNLRVVPASVNRRKHNKFLVGD